MYVQCTSTEGAIDEQHEDELHAGLHEEGLLRHGR
eukprot:CAMPEP_0197873532 /NCGR_PEP_ID=MMETSP1439-20131203/3320_1 /TAXON_ID=66791 /ORGANISM="Gonyaulax spinifera, Strain CCMP409" /LENGTH=34 /DNA_ID= /DNA_START= /DNA_END= /DNA_ORIENTATION=